MRSLTLSKNGLSKIRQHQRELRSTDVEESIKSLPPGEWCLIGHQQIPQPYLGFVNAMVDDKYHSIHLLDAVDPKNFHQVQPVSYLEKKISAAIEKRKRLKDYKDHARLCYGPSDGLPGLVADRFGEVILVQINTAGMDIYRSDIRTYLEQITGARVVFLDNPKYREREFLPTFPGEAIPDILVNENGISFKLRSEVIQKVGFYYDHRENRYYLLNLLHRLQHSYQSALDLFCYAGAWGIYALKGGVEKCTFVDQGDFSQEVSTSLSLNSLENQGDFYRADVFKFLDECGIQKKQFDVILCDPPAFAKGAAQKSQALEGYTKLHRKVLKVASPGALVVFSSCTHYVSHEEFQKNILDSAHKEGRLIQLIHSGMQGLDHPVSSLADRSNYIKSYFYLLEN
jgi:23S rRNA (cytosine1962-C5)-methyltransferase